MEKNHKIDLAFLLQRIALILFLIFPIALSLISQILVLLHSWSFTKFVQFGFLVTIFLTPVFAILSKNSIWAPIEKSKYWPIIWVVGLAVILRIVFVQLISTDFVSDMEDVHFFAIDLYSGNPLANIQNYPNIPGATHLNMTALVLSFVYRLFGASTFTAKLFLIVLGGLTTFLIYLAGQELVNKQVGFLAAFLFAILPSVICYTGVLAGDHLSLPLMILSIFIYTRADKLDHSKFFSSVLYYALIGFLVGLASWFRPFGMLLILAFIISFLLYNLRKWKFYKLLAILIILFVVYSQTSNLAVKISERIFQTSIPSASQRIGEFLLKGLNPESKGGVTLEDDTIANQAYQTFGDDRSGAQDYLIKLAISRLEPSQVIELFKNKFTLIWASHDALFDYSLLGSNDDELVNLMRSFEAVLYLVVTAFIFFQAITSIRQRSHPGVFVMQLFVLGFALLLLLVEVQNRYVMMVIPYSILLSVMGMKDTIPALSMKMKSR